MTGSFRSSTARASLRRPFGPRPAAGPRNSATARERPRVATVRERPRTSATPPRLDLRVARALPDLVLREELRLVDEDARDGGRAALQQLAEVRGRVERLRVLPEADARRDAARARAVVERRRQQQHLHAALLVVVRGLQERGRLARVHRRVVEIELPHRRVWLAAAWDCWGPFGSSEARLSAVAGCAATRRCGDGGRRCSV
mmetsp:Transcript_5758/g.18186  ORF Transcript_5758/g.18186 Transcript_5758/m.18186 type:complete len:202 (-) Transcript_5758:36-641(-)